MSLFQRFRTPFSEIPETEAAEARPGIGTILRERREELGLDLDVVGNTLRIKPLYLGALEQGRAQDLPGATYAIGFIRAYAQHLGLDAERVVDRYKSESSAIRVKPDLSFPVPLGSRSIPGVPFVLVALILALCGYGTWYYLSTGERSRPERVAAVPSQLEKTMLRPAAPEPTTPPPAAAPTVAPPTPQLSSGLTPPAEEAPPAATPATASLTTPTPSATPVTPATAAPEATKNGADEAATKPAQGIEIRALADCWIQVRSADDEAIVFSRVLKAGETYHVPRPGLLLRTGNAGALAIQVNGKDAPAIGGVGALRRNVALDPDALLAGTAVHG